MVVALVVCLKRNLNLFISSSGGVGGACFSQQIRWSFLFCFCFVVILSLTANLYLCVITGVS